MTLDPVTLRDSIASFFDSRTMPTGPVPSVVQQWATAYAKYGIAANAGPTLPISLIAPPGPVDQFSASLDSALRAMWMSVAWVGPSLIGTTLIVPPLNPILDAVSTQLIKSRDRELALSLITNALHTYTLGITVSIVSPIGATVIATLT